MGRELLLKTYHVIAKNYRNSITNISASAIGIASVLFVANLLFYETSYDEDLGEIYRVEIRNEGSTGYNAYTSSQLGSNLMEGVSNLQSFARLIPFSEYKSANLRCLSDTTDKAAYFKRAYYADAEVIDFFNLELLVGNKEDFEAPGSMIISRSEALNLFGPDWKTKAEGTELRYSRGSIQQEYRLIGVFADRDKNTHIDLDALIAISTAGSGEGIMSGYTYVSGVDIDLIVPSDSLLFRSVSDIHTSQGVSNEAEPVANRVLLMLISVVAVIILLITITNYVNNTIVHFVDRCKDIGIRKLHGASVGHLTLRLGCELLFVNLIAALIGLAVFILLVHSVNHYSLLTYPSLDQLQWNKLFLILVLTITINTALSAIYPFIFLRKIEIVSALKGMGSLFKTKAFGHAGNVVQVLLTFQIVFSIVFLSACLIIYKQLKLIDVQPTETEVRITGVFPGQSGANDLFANEALRFMNEQVMIFGKVISYSFSNMYLGNIKSEHKIILNDSTHGYLTVVDPDYFTDSTRLIDGTKFNPSFGYNSGQVILDSIISQTHIGYDDSTRVWHVNDSKYETIGIIEHGQDTEARGFVSGFRYLTYVDLVLNYQGSGGERLDQFLEKTEYIFSTKFPFFFLLRREQETSGKAEEEVLALFIFFGGVSVLVSVIGLFGMSYFVTRKKTREVGIRKIHGASSVQILARFLSDFATLVLVGGLIAAPLVYLGGNHWLENYKRRIDLDLTIILLPIIAIALVTLLTVLDKTWKAATLNPIDTLEDR